MFLNYLGTLPGAVTLGLIWGVMALGVFITYKVLDIPDLTVDGSFATGGAVCAVIIALLRDWIALSAIILWYILFSIITRRHHAQ